jgi:peroxiredoxin
MLIVALVVTAQLASGCSAGSGSSSGSGSGSGNGIRAAVGTVQLPAARRGAPLSFFGPTLEGKWFDSASFRGRVVVVNVWGAYCLPCRSEARDLEAAWNRLQGGPVQFVGLNLDDPVGLARDFQHKYGVTYPSLADAGKLLLNFRGNIPLKAVPVTVVIDRQGRLAARVVGPTKLDQLVDLVTPLTTEA